MARSTYIVLSNPAPGREEEFNDWYTQRHVPDVLRVPGWVAAQRLKLATAQLNGGAGSFPYRYLTLFDVEGDPQAGAQAMSEALADGMFISDAFRQGTSTSGLFTPMT